jgi:hypothetical protein
VFLLPKHVDYLCDLTYHGFISLGEHEIYTNSNKTYMFKDFDGSLDHLYGRGFNYSKSLDSKFYKYLSDAEVRILIERSYFDLIVY